MLEPVRQIKLKWPEHLWLEASNRAMESHTSIQTIITEDYLTTQGIQSFRKDNQTVEQILAKYDYVPKDIEEVINKIKDRHIIDKLEELRID